MTNSVYTRIDADPVDQTHIRSFAASFWLPTFCHSFMWTAEEVPKRPASSPRLHPAQ